MTFHTFILILHVLGASIVFAVVFFDVLLTMKSTWSVQVLDRLHYVGRFGMLASMWQLVTGIYLAASDWDELRDNHLFWAKLILYVLEGILASTLLQRKTRAATEQQKPRGINTVMLTHAVMILAIIVLGVMIVEQ